MKSTIILLLSLASLFIQAQSLEQWNAKKERLIKSQAQINDSLKIVDNAIRKLQIEELRNESLTRSVAIAKKTNLKNKEGHYISELQPGDSVLLIASEWYELQVLYKGQVGYVHPVDIIRDEEIDSFIDALEAKYREDNLKKKEVERVQESKKNQNDQQARANAERQQRERLITERFNKYGKVTIQKIIDRKIWVGMTDEMATYSWGKPDRINKTVTTFGVKEQWVYNNEYLYFENHELTSYQTSR